MRFVNKVFPDADIQVSCLDVRPIEVSIACEGVDIITVPQRDLFSKYGWPAEDEINAAMLKFKEDGTTHGIV